MKASAFADVYGWPFGNSDGETTALRSGIGCAPGSTGACAVLVARGAVAAGGGVPAGRFGFAAATGWAG